MNRFLPLLIAAAMCGTVPAAVAQQAGRCRFPPASPQLRQIRTQPVAAADVRSDEVVAPGRIVLDPRRVSRVSLPVAGRVTRLHVQIGEAVRAGQLLLTLDSAEAETALAEGRQAEAALNQARAGVRRAAADLERLRDLLEHKAVARKDVLHAEEDLVGAQAAEAQGEAAWAQARRRIEILGLHAGRSGQQVLVRAPIAGKILELSVTQGEYRTDSGAPVLTIADLTTVLVSSDVAERDIRLVAVGEAVSVELVAYPGRQFQGRVTRINDTVDPRTHTVQVQAEIANRAGGLRPEMYGRIRHSHKSRRVPVVPAQAVVQSARGPYVYVQRTANEFQRTPVVPGEAADGRVAILEGLRPGEQVVVDGVMLLQAQQSGGGR